MEKVSKEDAMSSMDGLRESSSTRNEYESLGHDRYFEKYQRLEGFTKEQFEVCKREWKEETWHKLYERESSATDDFI
jgi:hypothetical protein